MVCAQSNGPGCCDNEPNRQKAGNAERNYPNDSAQLLTCSLSSKEQAERRDTVLNALRAAAGEIRQDESGHSARYAAEYLPDLVDFIQFERDCCSFLTFRLTFEPDHGPVWLSVSGPPEAHGQLKALFSAFDAAETQD